MTTGLKRVRQRRDDVLSSLRWDAVERLLADYYRAQGWEVDHCGTGSGAAGEFDGGIDLKLRKDDAYVLVQSKHWKAYQVPHNAVHELLGVMVNESATAAVLVTSGEFTAAARAAARRLGHVQLVDGDQLRAWLGPMLPAQPVQSPVAMRPQPVRAGKGASKQPASMIAVALLGLLLLGIVLLMRSWMPSTGSWRSPVSNGQSGMQRGAMPAAQPRNVQSVPDPASPASAPDGPSPPGAVQPPRSLPMRQRTEEDKRAVDAIVEDIPEI